MADDVRSHLFCPITLLALPSFAAIEGHYYFLVSEFLIANDR